MLGLGSARLAMAANSPPVAVHDCAFTTTNTPVVMPVLANDSDPDGDPLTILDVSTPNVGTAVTNADNTITYTPATNFLFGMDTFRYIISDGQGGLSSYLT